jgi:hypothetical protein
MNGSLLNETNMNNPVHDAMGNLEAFEKLLNGER